ncbi:MAG TPA: amidohydrolase family protein [Blastocatellia bacterium]|nr:amidohydrolase family protein [Blastocatellia bacterium]
MKKLPVLLLLLLPLATIGQQQPSAPAPLAFTHVTVIDLTGMPARSEMTVVITGNRITAVGRTGKVRLPKGTQVVDATGKFLIPGLWDMHVHIGEAERSLPLFIANGVTGVRNMGGRPEQLFKWREEAASGNRPGPRIVACGPVVDGPQPANPDHAVPVKTAEEGRRAVTSLKQRGADFIKVYDGIPRDAYFAIADEAKKQGIPFVGHVPIAITTMEASAAGQKSIEHLGTILEGSSSVETELRNWADEPIKEGDFSAFPRRIAARGTRMLDTWNEQKATQIYRQLARHNTWQVPTLVVKYVQTFIDDIHRAGDERVKFIPPSVREWWSPDKGFFFRYRTPEYIVFRKRLFQKELEITGAMRRAGVQFLAGSDLGGAYTFPGFSLHDELALLVQAGFTPLEALQAATINPAKFLGELDSSGTVEKGKIASLVLLDADPLSDIRNTRRISTVVVNGRYLPKESLQKLLADAEAAAAGK